MLVNIFTDGGLPTSAQVQSTDGKAQVPMPWPNHLPQYMPNFQGPVFQQMPPYQGYLFPGLQVASPYFPGNMQWPPNMDDSSLDRDWEPDDHKKHKSSRNKKKSSHGKELEASNQDDSTEPSDSSSETESDENLQNGRKQSSAQQVRRKKQGKKSSRKVVIRNINYITSKRDGEKGSVSEETSDEDEFIDGEALKQQVKEAVGSLERRHKSTSRHRKKSQHSTLDGSNDATDPQNKNANAKGQDHWGAFQSLLMKDKDLDSFENEPHPLQFQEEHFATKSSEEGRSLAINLESEEVRKQQAFSNDSFVTTNRETNNQGESRVENFEAGENAHLVVKKRDSAYEDLLFSQRTVGSGNYPRATVSDYSTESLIIKSQREGDWFISNQLDKSINKDECIDLKAFDGDNNSSLTGNHFYIEKNKKDILADDSFIIQDRQLVDSQSFSLLRTDISMVPDIVEATQYENGTPEISHDKAEALGAHEPDDLYMVLGRDSTAEHAVSPWTPEMDYETNATEDKLLSDGMGTNGKTSGNPGAKVSSKEVRSNVSNRSLGKSKSDIMSRTKKPSSGGRPTVHKSKSEKVFYYYLSLQNEE